MRIQPAYAIDGAPVFGTFHGDTMAELPTMRNAGMNLLVGGERALDVTTNEGRFCREHGIRIMYGLAGQVHGRPRLLRDTTAEATDIPIADGTAPTGSNLVQLDDELIRYREATESMLLGCERGVDGTAPAAHELASTLFWPESARAEIERVKDSPNLWGYWVLDDSPGFTRSALLALYRLVKEVDGPNHAVCAGHSGLGTLRNFAPGTCDILAFYYYPFGTHGYLRTLNTVSAQWTLTEARRQVPGIPFLGVFQGFWESPTSQRRVNVADPLEPWQIREQVEDFVRDGAAGILGYASLEGNPTFAGWNSKPDLVAELRRISEEIRATGGVAVPEEPAQLAAVRIQPQGPWTDPNPITGIVPAWHLIAPFDAEGKGIAAAFPPEQGVDLSADYAGRFGPIRWHAYRTSAGALGLIETFGAPHALAGCIAYATCTVYSPAEQRVQMRIGSDDDGVVWLNGAEVRRHEGSRGVVPDTDIVPVTLRAGDNQVLVKVHNREDQWGLFMRFTGMSGEPLEGLSFSPAADDPSLR